MNRAMYAIPAVGLLWTGCGGVVNEAECGDGVVNGVEACDDGNDSDNDACTNACEEPRCGDGFVNNEEGGTELCDDANNVDNDACTNACNDARCGDGIVNNVGGGTETCDDENSVDTDGCLTNCESDPILRSFLLTKRANVTLADITTPYMACLSGCYGYGNGVYTPCTVDFNSPVEVSMVALMANGMYSRTRTCVNTAGDTNVVRQITGSISVITPRTKYQIVLNEATLPAVLLDCDMDAGSKLTCVDNTATPRAWELTPE